MKTMKYPITVATLLLVVLASGCQSTGARFAWWKPSSYWNRGDEAPVLASTTPELPSQQFAAGKDTAAPLADSGNAKVAATPSPSADTIASAPAADYSVFPSTPAASPASSPVAPQTGPYSPIATNPATTGPTATAPIGTGLPGAKSSAPAASTVAASGMPTGAYASPDATTAGVDRYAYGAGMNASDTTPLGFGSDSRYTTTTTAPIVDTASAASTPPATSAVATTSNATPTPENSSADDFDPYSRYSTPAVSTALTVPIPASTPSSTGSTNQAVASVELPISPGGYRPGGTSSYPTTQTSAVNVATRAGSMAPPSTPSSTTPSSYGGSSYR